MRIKIDFYDITLDVSIDNRCMIGDMEISPEQQFLNMLSIMAGEAAENMDRKGYDSLAERYREISNNIYEYLKYQGIYKNVKV